MKAHPILRVSNKIQSSDGNGLDSQLQAVTQWITQHSEYQIDRPLRLEGVSAYSKKHIPTILEFVNTLEPNSIIVFTEVSRLARMEFRESFQLLWSILDKKINIAFTQLDAIIKHNQETDSSLNMKLMMMFDLSLQESRVKSNRINQAFSERHKRLQAGTAIKRSGLPPWLEIVDDKYHVSDYSKETLEMIFTLKASGIGCYNIVKELNNDGRATFPRITKWSYGNINTILRNRSCLGEYQAYTKDADGKRTHKGDPIVGHYPQIISHELFAKAQLSFKRSVSGRGAANKNPFRGLVRCFTCNGSMTMNSCYPKGMLTRYLRCENSKNDVTHKCGKSLRYEFVESSILEFLGKFDLSDMNHIDDGTADTRHSLAEVTTQLEGLETLVVANPSRASVYIPKIQELTARQIKLTDKLNTPVEVPPDLDAITIDDPIEFNNALRKMFKFIAIQDRHIKFTLQRPSVGDFTADMDLDIPECDTPKLLADLLEFTKE